MAESPLIKVVRLLGGLVLMQGRLGHQVLGQLLVAGTNDAAIAGAAVVVAGTMRSRNAAAQVAIRTAAPAIAVQGLLQRQEKRVIRRDKLVTERERQIAAHDRALEREKRALEARVATLGHENATLRHEHARLQDVHVRMVEEHATATRELDRLLAERRAPETKPAPKTRKAPSKPATARRRKPPR